MNVILGEIEVDLHTLQRNEVVKLSTPLSKSCRKKNLRGEIQLTLLFNPVGKILRVTVNQVRKHHLHFFEFDHHKNCNPMFILNWFRKDSFCLFFMKLITV